MNVSLETCLQVD